ncbi:MAG TPA: fibrinogen-like YCDxxxxGGGW domain-containing protein [Polyangiaceae bacterium]|nr:fibrinogen-like YCDxxxxGGGW domain-containing protein [Polyangiaceae bacterium]
MRRFDFVLTGAVAAACQFPGYAVDSSPESGAGTAGTGLMLPGSSGGAAGSAAAPDPCLQSPCLNGGRCIATLAGSFVCLCEPGYRGDTCEVAFDNCNPDPCLNGGTCFDGGNTAFCDCPDGYEGATCEREHDDCLDLPCQNGGICMDGAQTRTCMCQPGFVGEDCEGGLLPSCGAILDVSPEASNGVYVVDPDGAGEGNPPLEVYCDMSAGGWTLVGEEHEGVGGTLKYLGVSVGDSSALAYEGTNALIGERFRDAYDEVWITWSNADSEDGIYIRIAEEMFVNSINEAIPVTEFFTTDDTLQSWVDAAGGAVLCRASQSPDVRPGDSSWAVKPKDDTNQACGCNARGWSGRGGFYGGHSDPTFCSPSGGGWSGVTDNGGAKGNVTDWWLQLWIR